MIKLYSVDWCPACTKVKKYLDSKDLKYELVTVDDSKSEREKVIELSGQMSVPVLDIGGQVVIGFNKEEIDTALEQLSVSAIK